MAGHGHHSFNGPPKPPVAHVPRIYRFTATALGAGMWFFVSRPRTELVGVDEDDRESGIADDWGL